MLLHLPIIFLASLQPAPVADAVPKFDIVRECQAEGGDNNAQDRCVQDEKQAFNQLQTEWTQFGRGAKSQCDRETNTDSSPSYVELLTCLEMERDVKNTPK
jgi:hypothetical protein